jgi:hypothetical protein
VFRGRRIKNKSDIRARRQQSTVPRTKAVPSATKLTCRLTGTIGRTGTTETHSLSLLQSPTRRQGSTHAIERDIFLPHGGAELLIN